MAENKKYVPFVSSETNMAEFTIRALIIGLVMAVVLGAANAYLGLKAGMTIAATYPAAVIGMALLRIMKGSVLEENFTRTVGSIGESIASGAIFTIPAFFLAGVWTKFDTVGNYIIASVIMCTGGILGIMFVTLLRRVMVEDAELLFPESIAAAEIHKAGRTGGTGAKFLFGSMGLGALINALGQFNLFAFSWQKFVCFAKSTINLKAAGTVEAQGGLLLNSPGLSPAFIGVGYIIGPKLASLIFSGSLLAWGLLVPAMLYFMAPELMHKWQVAHPGQELAASDWITWSQMIWRFIVKPMAIGGMLVGAGYTLFKMRKNLAIGLTRSIGDVKKAATGEHVAVDRVEHDLSFKWIMLGVGLAAIATFFIYNYFTHDLFASLVATVVMVIVGFFFAAISGYLAGIIGASNNPVSGLTISALVIAGLLMVMLGMHGTEGVAAVLGVAAITCVSSAVASEMFQDLKAGHILGGTPWRMQAGDIIGIVITAAVMFLPLVILHQGDINAGKMAIPTYEGGFGSMKLGAPQAGLMAFLAQGIVSGEMAWPLIIVGMLLGVVFILMQVRSPMFASIGMYLSLETTFAIFIGGCIKGILDMIVEKRKFSEAQKAKSENVGILLASGLIAGEALVGLVFATLAFFNIPLFAFFKTPTFAVSLVIFAFLTWWLVQIPLKNAGSKDQPMPPHISE
jgi:putative OPT family oligopeptide transporter